MRTAIVTVRKRKKMKKRTETKKRVMKRVRAAHRGKSGGGKALEE